MFKRRQNPSQTSFQSKTPQIDLAQSSNPISEELSWNLIEHEATYNSISSGSNKIAIPIDHYIVFLSDTFMRDPNNNLLMVFDTEKRTWHSSEILMDQLYDIDKCTACYWKDGQIIVLSWKKDTTGLSTEYSVYLGAIIISNNEGGMRVEYRSVPDAVAGIKTDYHTIHIYKNKLYIVSKIDLTAIFNRSQILLSYIDLESFQHEHVVKMDFQVLISSHFSYLFENKLHIYFRKEERYSKSSERIEVDLDTGKYQVHSEEGFFTLAEKRLQTQQVQENVYVFSRLNEYNAYRTLYIFNLKSQTWKEHQVNSNYCPHFKDKGIMTIVADQIFVFGSKYNNPIQSEIWSSPLPEKHPVRVDTMTMEQLESDQLGLSSLIDQFSSQVPYSDVKFQVESEIIPANKSWLVQKSKYFADLFSNRTMEPQASNIFILDVKASTFKVFLQWIYVESVDDLDPSLALDLFQQANRFGVLELRGLCEDYLIKNINEENYAEIAKVAEVLGANSLRESVVDFIAKNTKILQKRSDFMNLSNNLLKDAIMKLALSTNQI